MHHIPQDKKRQKVQIPHILESQTAANMVIKLP